MVQSIQYFAEAQGPCEWYRCSTPGRALARRGYAVAVDENVTIAGLDAADVIVFSRRHDKNIGEMIRYCKERGKLTVFELDDDLWNVHPDSPSAQHYPRPVMSAIETGLRESDLVTTTTAHLARRLRPFNRTVRVLPNMLPDDYWSFAEPREQSDDRIVIGWAGTNTHLPDLKLLSGVIEQVLDAYPFVEFAWSGMSEVPFRDHVRARPIPPVPIEHYPELLANFHIGLAPLVDNTFNQAKSDLKFLEYARLGIPVIASRTESYEHSVEHGVNGLLARNAKDWLKCLNRLIRDVGLRRTMGANAQEWAETRMMSTNVGLWEEAYGLVAQ